MFETGIRQLRMALGMVWGRRLDAANIGRLVEDALATLAEFGEPGEGAMEVLAGPLADPGEQREFAERSLRRTTRRLARCSPFYASRLAALGTAPEKLSLDTLRAVPVTTKQDLLERPGDFRCDGVTPHLATRTTGTTGQPAEVWLSRYEMELWPALGALASVLHGDLQPGDIMQVNVSSRAVAANHLSAASCRLAGAGCRLLGIAPPDTALDGLAGGGATLLSTCASYLAELVTAAHRRGMGPADFQLRRIYSGGEILSASLAQAACQTFGVPRVDDPYSMTEVIPVTARTCSQGHLHHEVNTGLAELLDLRTGGPAAPGALGTLVITPYFPYRECTPVLRYDTRDVARCLPEEPPGCELAGIPATGQILGKAGDLLWLSETEVVTPRQLVNAIEALPARPWPARYRAVLDGGRIQLTLPEAAAGGYGYAAARSHFAEAGLAVDLVLVGDDGAASLRQVRSDLHEVTFSPPPAFIGA